MTLNSNSLNSLNPNSNKKNNQRHKNKKNQKFVTLNKLCKSNSKMSQGALRVNRFFRDNPVATIPFTMNNQ